MMSGKLRWIALLLSGMLGVLPMAAGVPGKTVGGRSVGLALLGTGVEIVLSGHDHVTETTFFKGVRYETLESLKMNDISPGYNIFSYGKDVGRSFVAVE